MSAAGSVNPGVLARVRAHVGRPRQVSDPGGWPCPAALTPSIVEMR